MTVSLTDLPVEIVHEPGALDRLGHHAQALGIQRPLIVSDPGLLAAGHIDRALTSLRIAECIPSVFSAVRENPTTEDVDACLQAATEHGCDGFIGLGGGSSMDTAKGCNFLLTNGGKMRDYWGKNKAEAPMLPMIAIPTTAGTGSECQGFALITDPDSHRKMACGDSKAVPALVILDPALTLTQPPFVAACTAMDALSHAIETAVTTAATPQSVRWSHTAFHLLVPAFNDILADPQDLPARARLQCGAAFAGAAIEASMLGMAHAMANPLTATFDTVHGQAVGYCLPAVIRFNGRFPEAAAGYHALWMAGSPDTVSSPAEAVEYVAETVERLLIASRLAPTAWPQAPSDELIQRLAHSAADQWTAQFNPRTPSVEDFVAQYQKVFSCLVS